MSKLTVVGCVFAAMLLLAMTGCGQKKAVDEIVVYCSVDEPYASQVFAEFEKETGLHVAPLYDIESSKSVGLAGKLEAEKDHPRADVWWCSEAFLTVRLADAGVLDVYKPTTAADIPDQFKDADGYWTGFGLRARVMAVGEPAPPFQITSIHDLADPRLKDKVAIARPTAGSTGAHFAALYTIWGQDKARQFFHQLHDNGVVLLGGNAEVADQVGANVFVLGMCDNDDVSNTLANGGKLNMIIPDQNAEGTMAMPTTAALVKGAHHVDGAKRLIDFLVSKQSEQRLIDMKFARWSVRSGVGDSIKAFNLDYRAAAKIYPQAQREATAILEGREP
jgi:iron(III) transport system substrate-binding protein